MRLNDQEEIDLIIDRPGQADVLVEIKSTAKIKQEHTDALLSLADDFPTSELYVLANDPESKSFGRVK